VTDVVAGIGDEALPGMVVVVHYTGWLYDPAAPGHRGRQFDSSRERGRPLSFPLGAGRVIRGWEQGMPGMRVGGTRRLVIPPELAYGARSVGNGLIPPHSTLLFEVELLAVETVTYTPDAR
jgi:FKBP-type peptidyl-prolyl cis-trans isomerase